MSDGLLMLEEYPSTWEAWKVSWKWITKRWNCTVSWITDPDGCGSCCKGKVEGYWPPRRLYPGEDVARCVYLGPKGCTLSLRDKPIGCMLTPLMLKNNTLIVMHRLQFKTSMCKGACGTGPMLIDVLKNGLVEIFGNSQWEKVREDVTNERDSVFYLSPLYQREFIREGELQWENKDPIPRSTPI